MNTTIKIPPRQQLAAERMRRRWTQQEVADQLGTTPGNVSRWERGITSPSPYFRRKLCELFGRRAHELGLAWEASAELPAQMPTSPTFALKEAQAHTGRGGTGSVQTAMQAASCSRDGSWALLVVKATPPERRGEGLTMLVGGRPRPEHGPEQFVQAGTPRLPIPPDRVLVLDQVEEVRLVVDLPGGREAVTVSMRGGTGERMSAGKC
jgi:transcriptional regulator with XRE-family HTH domain